MADVGTKRQSGQTRARTVFKLLPVRYKITLSYLGDERIQQTPRIDGNRLLDDVRQPSGAKLGCDERRGCTLLRRPGDAEPERV